MSYENETVKNQKRASSIARKIHAGYWFNKLWAFICIDIIIFAAMTGMFFFNCETAAGSLKVSKNRINLNTDDYNRQIIEKHDTTLYIISNSAGKDYVYDMTTGLYSLKIVITSVFVLEGISLFFSFFGAGKVRKKLKPEEWWPFFSYEIIVYIDQDEIPKIIDNLIK